MKQERFFRITLLLGKAQIKWFPSDIVIFKFKVTTEITYALIEHGVALEEDFPSVCKALNKIQDSINRIQLPKEPPVRMSELKNWCILADMQRNISTGEIR